MLTREFARAGQGTKAMQSLGKIVRLGRLGAGVLVGLFLVCALVGLFPAPC